MEICFIVFCVYLGSLFFRAQRIPGPWAEFAVRWFLPENLVLHVESASFGFRQGLHLCGFRLYDASVENPLRPVLSAATLDYGVFSKEVRAEALTYPRLPEGYYRDGAQERNEAQGFQLPDGGRFSVVLSRPDILGIRPERLEFDLNLTPRRLDLSRVHLDWPDRERRMSVDGFCYLDLDRQEVYGEVAGLANTAHIRPLIVTLDVPVALPYMDAFTEVPEPCPTRCAWKVDLVHNDFDLWLDLNPTLGRYNGVPMKKAKGTIHLNNGTRDGAFRYATTVGPISAVDLEGRPLDGTVVIGGTNGQNRVTVKATSGMPLADVLRIGGFTGDYVSGDVVGRSTCDMEFRFPRAMTNNYEVLNGRGHVEIRDGCLLRMKGFRGLIEAMPKIAPAVTWLSDSTQASGDYTIENGVIRSDNVYIEGSCFSIKMTGKFDAGKDMLDFDVLVQFAKKDSLVGKILQPLTWPFSKLLLEFRLTGSPANPKWRYVTVVDRVMEVVK